MKQTLISVFVFWVFIVVAINAQQLKITEVMFDAVGADYYDEYIEIFNADSATIDLKGYSLQVNGELDPIDSPLEEWLLPAGTFGIILDRGYLIERKSTTYEHLIPTNVPRFTIKDASFGKSGLNNSTPNVIKLINALGDTLGCVTTFPDQLPGYSEEKKIITESDEPSNWGNSKVLYGTPGYRNSITPHDYDLAVTRLTYSSSRFPIAPNQAIEFQLTVQNVGLQPAESFELLLGIDQDLDYELSNHEVLYRTLGALDRGDSLIATTIVNSLTAGEHSVIAQIIYQSDEYEEDNFKQISLPIAYPKGCLAITEFMYYPLNDGTGEWVELLNVSSEPINLKNWTLGDQSTRTAISKQDFHLLPQRYVVIANDSTLLKRWSLEGDLIDAPTALPTLNNTGDSIVIRDHCGQSIDSLYYSNGWGYKQGVSLERKNPYHFSTLSSNWGLSRSSEGATPGAPNSLLLQRFNLAVDSIRVCSTRLPFEAGEPAEIQVWLSNQGLDTVPSWSVAIQLFRSRPGTTEILLDTLLLETTPLPPYGSCRQVIELDSLSGGIWQVLARVDFALDGDPSDNEATSVIRVGYPAGGVVINEVMYYPASEAPEWLEIYNLTRNEIDLNGWRMRKAKGSWLTLCDQTFILLPNEYLVVAANPNLGQFYPDFTARYLCPASFPLLSNTGDSLFLCDAVGKVQESIYYSAYWGGKLNVSVERINPYQPAVTANNWGSAQAPAGATPGGINSIARRTFDLKIDSVYTSLNYCRQGEDITACVTVSNYGLEPFSGGKIQLQVKSAHPERLVSAAEVPLPSDLLPDRQLTLSCPILSIAGGVYQIVASIIAEHDQNAANNRDSCSLSVGYSPGQVYITEILYKPATGEAEWFELYNAGSDTLNLQGWQLRTALDNWKLLTDSTIFLLPRDFLVIAAQDKFLLRYPDFKGRYIIPPTFPSLNNTSDSLILRDAAQLIADVAYYRDLLGSKSDISIEKFNVTADGSIPKNWQLCQAPIGATPGQRNSIQRFNHDLVLQAFVFKDTLSDLSTPARFEIAIHNLGLESVHAFELVVYAGVRALDTVLFERVVWEQQISWALAPDSSLLITGNIAADWYGATPFLGRVYLSGDEDESNNTSQTQLLVSYPNRALTINEFLAYPDDNQTEFVELVNISDLNVNLKDWRIYNNYKAAVLPEFYLASGEYLILVGDSACFDYFDCHAPVLVLPKWPGLNNVADKIKICDLTGKGIDSVGYDADWEISAGYSMEKRLPIYNSNDRANWSHCICTCRATPGKLNSVTPLLFDVSLDSVRLSSCTGDTNTVFRVEIFYHNAGQLDFPGGKIRLIHEDVSGSYQAGQTELKVLAPEQADSLVIELGPYSSGRHLFRAILEWSSDQNEYNDTLYWRLEISYAANRVLLSEFMPDPPDLMRSGISNAEYIEIFNPGKQVIDLSGWQISDNNTARRVTIAGPMSILPGGYVVIASDSSIFQFSGTTNDNTIVLPKFPSLNNDEDEIYLYDPTGQIIDALHYLPTWKITRGYSLERINWRNANNAQNWRSCVAVAGGTPGLPNSVALQQTLSKPGLSATPRIFTPNGDRDADEICLQYQLPFPSARLTIEIYNLEGRLISKPAHNIITAAEGAIFWDGKSNTGEPARIGLYLARCMACDLASNKNVDYITTFALFK
jgi:hypothetical protein